MLHNQDDFNDDVDGEDDLDHEFEDALRQTDEDPSDDTTSDNSDDDDDEDDEDDDDDQADVNTAAHPLENDVAIEDVEMSGLEVTLEMDLDKILSEPSSTTRPPSAQSDIPGAAPARQRSLSPTHVRRQKLMFSNNPPPKSFVVEAIIALPHPVPTHSLASSSCMTHFITGSEDGYIRDYDIFTAANGKNFLTAPQRHHSGVVEGILKSAQIRYWWDNQVKSDTVGASSDTGLVSLPIYSLAMHSDALWTLAGTNKGSVNLYTVRHEPGRLCYVFRLGHRGHPVSSLCLDHHERGFFSGGWDGDAILWDLNTGQIVRNFLSHGAQLVTVSIRPENAVHAPLPSSPEAEPSEAVSSHGVTAYGAQDLTKHASDAQNNQDADAKSDASFDPLFDDEPPEQDSKPKIRSNPLPAPRPIAPPKNAPPLLDQTTYSAFSPDMLMTAYIDGQVVLWDRRTQTSGAGVGRLWMNEKTPPWCLSACWSANGNQLYAGRRNGTVDVWDVRQYGSSPQSARLLKTLKNPGSSGVVSCIVAFPDNRHIACASVDNLRLWNAADAGETDGSMKPRSGMQFKIIPGHHGGYISQMLIDPGSRFLVSASSNRGWHGDSTRTVFVHDIRPLY